MQDMSGVIFRALDTETDRTVAIRRFFPFGPTGGGLSESEKIDFTGTLDRLAEIKHPALRTIVCGGCDPVDGMPYIATEWIEGHSLQTLLMDRSLSPEEMTLVLDQALEVCQILSDNLGSEGVWVETDPHAIIIGAPETQRPVSFWISPLIWTDRRNSQTALETFIPLTVSAMGWSEIPTHERPTTGPGAWVKWLQNSAGTATLQQARESLATATGTAAPTPTQRVVRQATRQVLPGKKKAASKAPAWILAVAVLLVMGLGGWMMVRRNTAMNAAAIKTQTPTIVILSAAPPAPAAISTPKPAEPKTALPVVEKSAAVSKVAPSPVESPAQRASRLAAEQKQAKQNALKRPAPARSGVLSPANYDLLVPLNNKDAIVEGTLASIGYSGSKKTMYLIFAGNLDVADFRGAIAAKDATGDLSETALGTLKGKKIRLSGKIRLELGGSRSRPVIDIGNRTGIQLAE